MIFRHHGIFGLLGMLLVLFSRDGALAHAQDLAPEWESRMAELAPSRPVG